jgi:hypothetical protein
MTGGAAALSAHEHFRIIGTITNVTDREMHVKNKDSKTFTIRLTKRTIVKRDKDKAELAVSVLKVEQSVVVDALGDNESDLEALDIRIVPPIGSKPAK